MVDAAILELNRTGDNQNKMFYDIIWPERAHILRCALFLTHKTSEAEDLTQETLVKAWRAVETFDLREHGVRPWLLTILKNSWRDMLRSRKRRSTESSLDEIGEDPPAPEAQHPLPSDIQSAAAADMLLNGFSDLRIIDALRSLHDEFRWTLLLVDVSNLSYEEAASLLEVPVGTVRSRLFRGREMLRDNLLRDYAPACKDP